MNSRKKLIISLSSLGLAIVAAIGITFGVLAAQNQAVTNTFTITYQAEGVNATTYAKYKFNDSTVYFTGGDQNVLLYTISNVDHYIKVADVSALDTTDDEAIINALYTAYITNGSASTTAEKKTAIEALSGISSKRFGQTTTSATLTAESFNLTAANQYAILTFAFFNDIAAGGNDMVVSLADGTTKQNVNCHYLASTNAEETANTIRTTGESSSANFATDAVNPGDYVYVHILVEIAEESLNASYVSDASHAIVWTLTAQAPVQGD